MVLKIEDQFFVYRQKAEKKEEQLFYKNAAFSKDHTRNEGPEDDHRMPYKRDVDRIVHSKAYARYVDKTQVAYLIQNDHISHRSLHVQLVSNFARGIAEILRLNLDLVEAIALGHDVGHPPFGHEGEIYLSGLSEEYGAGSFTHPLQSCRLLTIIEPLNLGLHVYDGFLCHDGGMQSPRFTPCFGKTWVDHLQDREQKKINPELNIMPATLEGCLVKLCDTMSYLGRDIEDAITLGILKRSDVPQTHLGNSNREILSVLARDIILHSFEKDYIEISEEAFHALKVLRQFNFDRIYHHPRLKVESNKIKNGYRTLFELLLEGYQQDREGSHLWRSFLSNKSEHYLQSTSDVQKVIDYVSGMTDSYFVHTLEKIFIPRRIEL